MEAGMNKTCVVEPTCRVIGLRIPFPLSEQRPPQIFAFSSLLSSSDSRTIPSGCFSGVTLARRHSGQMWWGPWSWPASRVTKRLRFFHRTLTPPYQWMNHCSSTPPSRKFTTAWMTSLEADTVFWRDWGPRDWPWRWGPSWGTGRRPFVLALSKSVGPAFTFWSHTPKLWYCDSETEPLSLGSFLLELNYYESKRSQIPFASRCFLCLQWTIMWHLLVSRSFSISWT